MVKPLSFSVILTVFAGCKADAPAPATTASRDPAAESASPGATRRSAKIDLRRGPRAAADEPTAPGVRPAQPAEEREAVRAERVAAYDSDGDGKISDAEREVARDKRAEQMRARLDADQDGQISETERQAGRVQRTENMRTQFDTDADGKLTPEELKSSPFARFAIDNVDKDGNGDVSAAELDAAIKAKAGLRRARPALDR